jgi:hypothetical protein
MAHTFHMVTLGPSRVGKSSLLATMCHEIGKMTTTGFQIIPIGETKARLDEAYQKISGVDKILVFEPVAGLMGGTADFLEYHFEVHFMEEKEFDLFLHDFRGGALTEGGRELARLQNIVSHARILINVLDAAALMEVDASTSNRLNGHDQVCHLLRQTLQAGEKYLILFVLVKCESYLKTERRRKELTARFEERHQAVLQLINQLNDIKKSIVALLIPAQTMGCVEFQEIRRDGKFIFVRTQEKFKPCDVDQPLRYALAFALKHVDEHRQWWERLRFTRRKAFWEALRNFCSQRKSDYKKYGNEALLETP